MRSDGLWRTSGGWAGPEAEPGGFSEEEGLAVGRPTLEWVGEDM